MRAEPEANSYSYTHITDGYLDPVPGDIEAAGIRGSAAQDA